MANIMLPYADRPLSYNQIMNKCNKTIIDQFYGNNTLVVMDFYFNIFWIVDFWDFHGFS